MDRSAGSASQWLHPEPSPRIDGLPATKRSPLRAVPSPSVCDSWPDTWIAGRSDIYRLCSAGTLPSAWNASRHHRFILFLPFAARFLQGKLLGCAVLPKQVRASGRLTSSTWVSPVIALVINDRDPLQLNAAIIASMFYPAQPDLPDEQH